MTPEAKLRKGDQVYAMVCPTCGRFFSENYYALRDEPLLCECGTSRWDFTAAKLKVEAA